MLWTDKIWVSSDDLSRVDSEVLRVSTSENITLDGVNGLIRGGLEEATSEIMKFIVAFGGYLNSGDLTSNHFAAVMNVGIGNSVRQKVGLQQIVISGDVPGQWFWLKQWTVFHVLRCFYRDAFGRLGQDRYKDKMDFFRDELQRRITPNIYSLGVPIVIRPLSRPGAFFERNSGTWDSTNLSQVPGLGTSNKVSFDVAITWVDQSQANFYVNSSQRNNSESDASDIATIQITTGNVISVSISSLNPPTGKQDPSQQMIVVVSPRPATGWNVYVGNTGGTLYLQNSSPIPIGTTSFTLPGDPSLQGATPGIGQYPDRRLSVAPMRQRA